MREPLYDKGGREPVSETIARLAASSASLEAVIEESRQARGEPSLSADWTDEVDDFLAVVNAEKAWAELSDEMVGFCLTGLISMTEDGGWNMERVHLHQRAGWCEVVSRWAPQEAVDGVTRAMEGDDGPDAFEDLAA